MTAPIYTKTSSETAMEARIFSRSGGGFTVALFDIESERTIQTFTIFRDIASAIDFANSLTLCLD